MINALFKIKRANGNASHEPILLHALIQEMEEGRIEDNRIFYYASNDREL